MIESKKLDCCQSMISAIANHTVSYSDAYGDEVGWYFADEDDQLGDIIIHDRLNFCPWCGKPIH